MSRGNTGRGLGTGNSFIDNQYFDATMNINQNIQDFESFFDLIVLSTWESEDTSAIIENDKLIIVKNRDEMLDREDFYKNNKYRQFYSLLNGLKVAKEYECSFIVKTRTDIAVDAKKLLALCKTQPEKIWVRPCIKPNFLEDFYFAGNLQNVTVLTQAILRRHGLYIRVHEDLFYSYLFQKSNLWRKMQVWKFFPRTEALSNGQAKLIHAAWATDFSMIPRLIWHGTVWRGFQFPSEFSQSDIDEESQFRNWYDVQQMSSGKFFKFSVYNFLLFVVGPSLGSKIDRKIRSMK